MKNKGKTLFIILFTALISICALTAISLYDSAKNNQSKNYQEITYYYDTQMQLFAMHLANQLNPEYQIIRFDQRMDETNQKIAYQEFSYTLNSAVSLMLEDSQFYYYARYSSLPPLTNLNKDIDNIDFNDYGFKVTITYDQKGGCKLSDEQYVPLCVKNTINDFIGYYSSIDTNYVEIAYPSDFEVTFMLPRQVEGYTGLSGRLNSWEQYNEFCILTLCVGSIVVGLFILFYPSKYVAISNPFKLIATGYYELTCALLSLSLFTLIPLLLIVTGTTINGQLNTLLVENGLDIFIQSGNLYTSLLLLIFNFILWAFTFICIALCVFAVKYIFVNGIANTLKKNTFIGYLWSKSIRYFKNFHLSNITQKNKKIILYLVVINTLIIICLISLGPVGVLFAPIYALVCYLLAIKQCKYFETSYDQLLQALHSIINQDYEALHQYDFGLFEDSYQQLIQLSENMQTAIEDQVKSTKLKTELISNVSHDLKTPLTAIKNYVALLENEQLSEDQRKQYITQLTTYTNRLKRLIEDLFEISKVDSGNIQLNYQPLNIVELVNQVILENEECLQANNISILKNMPQDSIVVNLDSDKTYRIFENLLTNIGKYALKNSRAYVNITQDDALVKIEMSNISAQPMNFTAQEITERFVRGDKSRSQQGAGLGLAIAKSFTEAQNGRFDLSIEYDLFKVSITFDQANINR